MTETKFRNMLQTYANTPVNTSVSDYACSCTTYERFKAFGLVNLWDRVVLHAISQNGEYEFKSAIEDDEPLCALFDWKQTAEGYIFWRKVYKRICCS